MRDEYDIENLNPRKNPYSKRLKKQVTINIDCDTISFFKAQSDDSGIPYQTLINLYLSEKAAKAVLEVKNPSAIDFKINSGWIFQKWSRRESNPCPKTNSLFFYYHSLFFFIPSALRKQTSSEFQ